MCLEKTHDTCSLKKTEWKRSILFCPLASFINSFMNNKRHVRETENLLHGLILVDTSFKQV